MSECTDFTGLSPSLTLLVVLLLTPAVLLSRFFLLVQGTCSEKQFVSMVGGKFQMCFQF